MALSRTSRLIGVLMALAGLAAPASAQIDERQVKAAYIYNFIQFTQWPQPLEEPMVLCVLGRSDIDAELRALHGRVVLNGLRVQVRHQAPADDLSPCQVLYLDESQRGQWFEVQRRLRGMAVLTVTDADGLADRGAMIEIGRREQRLTFEVNLAAARTAGLMFSARMLKLASYVNLGR